MGRMTSATVLEGIRKRLDKGEDPGSDWVRSQLAMVKVLSAQEASVPPPVSVAPKRKPMWGDTWFLPGIVLATTLFFSGVVYVILQKEDRDKQRRAQREYWARQNKINLLYDLTGKRFPEYQVGLIDEVIVNDDGATRYRLKGVD